jgi:hypothetical protein
MGQKDARKSRWIATCLVKRLVVSIYNIYIFLFYKTKRHAQSSNKKRLETFFVYMTTCPIGNICQSFFLIAPNADYCLVERQSGYLSRTCNKTRNNPRASTRQAETSCTPMPVKSSGYTPSSLATNAPRLVARVVLQDKLLAVLLSLLATGVAPS